MKSALYKILKKVEAVQLGLLRCENNEKRLLLQARAGTDEEFVNCIVNTDAWDISLLSQNVSLIQKDKQDYLYITCRVKEEIRKDAAAIVSMEVLRACWFTRKSRGSVTWLQEKYMYEAMQQKMDKAS
jgi:hypothetical protein